MRESERFLNFWVFEGISNPWIWTPEIQDGIGPNSNPILVIQTKDLDLALSNPNLNSCHPNRPQKTYK